MLKLTLIKMENKARSFVAIIIVIATATLLLRFGIEQLIMFNIAKNESLAQTTLKLVSTALENYAKDNRGVFPTTLDSLTQKNQPYLKENYIAKSPLRGYNYSCLRIEPSGYSCSASPTKCLLSGKNIYTITTGGSLVQEKCSEGERE